MSELLSCEGLDAYPRTDAPTTAKSGPTPSIGKSREWHTWSPEAIRAHADGFALEAFVTALRAEVARLASPDRQ